MTDTNGTDADESNVNRRRVLQSVATAGAAAGLGGVGAAATPEFTQEEAAEATREYRDREAVVTALSRETDLLEAVSEAGYLEEPTVDGLGVETLGEPASEEDSTVVVDPHSVDGGVTAEILLAREDADGRLVISVLPEVDKSFALYKHDGADDYEEVYVAYCGDCDDNEECRRTCTMCGSETCVGCDGVSYEKPTYRCECVEDCGSW